MVKVIAGLEQIERQIGGTTAVFEHMERQFRKTARRFRDAGKSMAAGMTQPLAAIARSASQIEMAASAVERQFRVTMGGMTVAAVGFASRLREQFSLATEAANKQEGSVTSQAAGFGGLWDQILQVVQGFTSMHKSVTEVSETIGNVAKWVGALRKQLGSLRSGSATLAGALRNLGMTKTKLIIVGLLAVVAVVLYVITHWEQVSAVASRVWSAVSGVVLYAASLIVRGVALIISAFAAVIPGLSPAADAVRGWADALKGAAGTAMNSARSASAIQETGKSAEQAAQSANQAAEAQQQLGDAMIETADAAGGNLQSFDQVHQLQEQMAQSPAAAAPPESPGMEIPGLGDMGGMMQQFGQGLAEGWTKLTESLSAAWETLKTRASETFPWLGSLMEGLGTIVQYVRDNWSTIAPVLESVVGVLLLVGAAFLIASSPIAQAVAVALAFGAAVGWIIANWETVGPILTAIWEAILAVAIPIWNALVAALSDIWNGLRSTATAVWAHLQEWWATWGETVIALLTGVWQMIGLVILTAINLVRGVIGFVLALIRGDWEAAWNYVLFIGQTLWNYLVGILQILWQTIVAIWTSLQDNMAAVWDAIYAKATEIWTGLMTWISDVWNAIYVTATEIWTAMVTWLTDTWNGIWNAVVTVWSGIWEAIGSWWDAISSTTREVWNSIVGWLGSLWDGIVSSAGTVWQAVWETIGKWVDAARERIETTWNTVASVLANIWSGIRETAASIWDGILEAVKSPINRAIALINRFLTHLSSIEVKIPEVKIPGTDIVFGGGRIGFPRIPSIPMLAEGGIVTGPTLAVVGEAGPEAVIPLSRGGFAGDLAEAVGQAVFSAVRQALQGSSRGTDREEIVLQLDGQRLARLLLPAITREGERIGSAVVRIQEV